MIYLVKLAKGTTMEAIGSIPSVLWEAPSRAPEA